MHKGITIPESWHLTSWVERHHIWPLVLTYNPNITLTLATFFQVAWRHIESIFGIHVFSYCTLITEDPISTYQHVKFKDIPVAEHNTVVANQVPSRHNQSKKIPGHHVTINWQNAEILTGPAYTHIKWLGFSSTHLSVLEKCHKATNSSCKRVYSWYCCFYIFSCYLSYFYIGVTHVKKS